MGELALHGGTWMFTSSITSCGGAQSDLGRRLFGGPNLRGLVVGGAFSDRWLALPASALTVQGHFNVQPELSLLRQLGGCNAAAPVRVDRLLPARCCSDSAGTAGAAGQRCWHGNAAVRCLRSFLCDTRPTHGAVAL